MGPTSLAFASADSAALERVKNKDFGEKFTFLGWSPDSLYVAYTLDRVKRPLGPRKPPRVRIRHIMRRVYQGHLGSLNPLHGKRLLAHVKNKRFVNRRLRVEPLEKNRWHIETPSSPVFLRIDARKELTWTLSSSEGTLAEGTLRKPYIRFEPQAYLAPNGKMLLLAMQVNTGWYEDAVVQASFLKPPAK